MKILTIIPSYKPAFIYGGPVRSVAALCEALVAKGHEVSVLTTNANGKTDLPVTHGEAATIDGVQVTYFKRLTGDHSNFSPVLLRAFWQQCTSFDVVHIHSWWNLVTIPVMMMCLLKKITPVLSPRGSITAYTIQHQKSFAKNIFHSAIGSTLLGKAVMHVTTAMEKQDVESLVHPKATFVIPNILQLPQTAYLNNGQKDHLKLLYLGRIDPKKNIELLLNTLLHNFHVPYTLEIVGDGDMAYINSLKQYTSSNRHITWSDPIHSNAKWQTLASADLLLLPSYNENYGNVILESLSQGTPVMISDQVGLKDYIEENQLGWVLPNDPIQWRSTLQHIWENPSALKAIRDKAPVAIQQHFNIGKLTEDYIDMYYQVQQLNHEQ